MQKISVSVELFKGWKRKLHVHVPHQKTPEEHVCNCQKSTFQQNLLDGGGGVRLTRPNREALAASITNFIWDLFRRRVGIARQAESVLSVLQDGRVNRLLSKEDFLRLPLPVQESLHIHLALKQKFRRKWKDKFVQLKDFQLDNQIKIHSNI